MAVRTMPVLVRLNETEHARLSELATRDGLSMSGLVRLLINRHDWQQQAEAEDA